MTPSLPNPIRVILGQVSIILTFPFSVLAPVGSCSQGVFLLTGLPAKTGGFSGVLGNKGTLAKY